MKRNLKYMLISIKSILDTSVAECVLLCSIGGIKKNQVSQARSVLDRLLNCAEQNWKKIEHGHQYEETIKLFASYVKMLGGTLLYETIYKNLPTCFPSPTTVNRYLKD